MCIRQSLVFINAYTKFYQNSSICSEDIEEKHIHSSLISMSMQSLKKIGQKLLKLESRNDIFTSIKGHNSVVYKQI